MADSTSFERTALVVNPHSGNGKTGRQWLSIEAEACEAVGPHEIYLTEGPGHATEVTREALRNGFDRIVSVGGDGTAYEVVNGFFDGKTSINPEAALAFLPLGTGSDFRKTLGIPKGSKAIPILRDGRVIRSDVGRILSGNENGEDTIRYFLNSVHIGVGGKVGELVNNSSKVLGGFSTFLLALIWARLIYRCLPMKVNAEAKTFDGKCLEVIIANGQYDGGGMRAAPKALLDNGLFEVYVLGNVGVIETVFNLPLIYFGKLHLHPKVQYYRASSISVSSTEQVLVSPDGELAGETPVSVEVVPQAIRLQTGPSPPLQETSS